MRKLSKLLNICKKYHELWGGDQRGMCFSAIEAKHLGRITCEECCEVEAHSIGLVKKIVPEASYIYLFEALGFDRTYEPDRRLLKDLWEDHINTLKENGL